MCSPERGRGACAPWGMATLHLTHVTSCSVNTRNLCAQGHSASTITAGPSALLPGSLRDTPTPCGTECRRSLETILSLPGSSPKAVGIQPIFLGHPEKPQQMRCGGTYRKLGQEIKRNSSAAFAVKRPPHATVTRTWHLPGEDCSAGCGLDTKEKTQCANQTPASLEPGPSWLHTVLNAIIFTLSMGCAMPPRVGQSLQGHIEQRLPHCALHLGGCVLPARICQLHI